MPPALRAGGAAALAAQNRSPSRSVAHWIQVDPDILRWDQSFPYQLLGVRRERGGAWKQDDAWQFTLPINPQSLTMELLPPTELLVNETGTVEVVDEVRLRSWQLAGTFGMMPLRPAVPPAPFQAARTIFAGTVARAQGVATAAQAVGRDIFPPSALPAHVLRDSDIAGTDVGRTTGYFQFRLLDQFIERYYSAKKADPALHLALAIWKIERVFLVKLNAFRVSRAVPRVHHWDYVLAGQSWASVSLDRAPGAFERPSPLSTSPDRLSAAIQALRDLRRVLTQSRELITTAVGDVSRLVLEPLREVGLLLADTAGTSVSLADLPRTIIQSARDPLLALLSARDATAAVPSSVLDRLAAAGDEVEQLRALGARLARSDTRVASVVVDGALLNDPALRIFEDPDAHHDFFAAIRPGDLALSPRVVGAIADERARVRRLGRPELEERRNRLQTAADQLAAVSGWSSPTYEASRGRPYTPPTRTPTDAELETLFALNQAAQVLDSMAAHAPSASSATERALRHVSGLANAAGVPFEVPPAKRQIPYPAGCTLEQVAGRPEYLGDPDRWNELAVLNNLRPPYVDEVGFRLGLLVRGADNRVVVPSGGQLPEVGDRVTLLANTVPPMEARVLGVRPYGAATMLQLDVDTSVYRPEDQAYVHSYLPGTVHGGSPFWIPDPGEPAEDDFSVRDPMDTDLDRQLQGAGTDLLLTQEGDLVVTPDGDCRYARGLALVTQVVRDVVATPRGSKLRHPSFGLPEQVGESVTNVTPAATAVAVREAFSDDPLFRGVEQVAVTQDGRVVRVGVNLQVRGLDRPLPLSVEVR